MIDVAPTARRLQDRQRHRGTGKDETVGGNVCVLTKHIPTGHFMPIVLSPAVSFQSAVGQESWGGVLGAGLPIQVKNKGMMRWICGVVPDLSPRFLDSETARSVPTTTLACQGKR